MRSYAADFELVEMQGLAAALELLGAKERWRPMAGGTDLMVLFNAGKLEGRKFFSVRQIPELIEIEVQEDSVAIGAAMTFSQIRSSKVLQREFPLLCHSASWTGGLANQNRATIGGNIMNASPAADSPPSLLAYEAELELISKLGSRRIPYIQFHTGYKQMQIRSDELLCKVHLKRPKGDWKQYGRKVGARKAQAISKVCVAAMARMEGRVINDIRLSLGSVAATPLRCVRTESDLRGQTITAELIAAAKGTLTQEIAPIDDIRSTASYRSQVAQNLLGEFLVSLL
jgi:CO/xanthine dehydrogenase FAD-binding subunit